MPNVNTPDTKADKSAAESKTTDAATTPAMSDAELDDVSGGLNPQPLPPIIRDVSSPR